MQEEEGSSVAAARATIPSIFGVVIANRNHRSHAMASPVMTVSAAATQLAIRERGGGAPDGAGRRSECEAAGPSMEAGDVAAGYAAVTLVGAPIVPTLVEGASMWVSQAHRMDAFTFRVDAFVDGAPDSSVAGSLRRRGRVVEVRRCLGEIEVGSHDATDALRSANFRAYVCRRKKNASCRCTSGESDGTRGAAKALLGTAAAASVVSRLGSMSQMAACTEHNRTTLVGVGALQLTEAVDITC